MIKFFMRLLLIGALMALGATLIAGPDRVGALLSQVQTKVAQAIDDNIDDPVTMRRQLRDLEREYPERISQVRNDLSELKGQIRQIKRERAVAARVVELTESDLAGLQEQVQEEGGQATAASSLATAAVRFKGSRFSVEQAYARMSHINRTRLTYAAQVQDADRDLGYLQQQARRLEEILDKLEAERQQFQNQIWQLDRQVDAMARNDRLITLMQKRQKTIDELGRYRVNSLDQLEAKLNEIRTRQEAALQVLSNLEQRTSYEDRARLEVDFENCAGDEWHSEVRLTVPADQFPVDF